MRTSYVLPLRPITRLLPLLLAAACASSPALAQTSAEDVHITLGKSVALDYPADITRISTTSPDIVDTVAVSTREMLLQGKGYGAATVIVWVKSGARTFYNVSVEHNLEPIRRLLKDTFPEEPIQVQSARDTVTLNGRVSSQAVADRAAAMVGSLAKTVLNNMQVTPMPVEKQILLRVKFAELDRNLSHEFGVNLLSTGAANTPGLTSTGQFAHAQPTQVSGTIGSGLTGSSATFNLTDALNIFAFRPDLNLGATIRALQSSGVLQILAEPNLITSNEKEASFLVGGEFPIPVLQGGSNSGSVTIQFREFGIRLTFTPVLTSHQTIKMHVKPEVSTIDLANAVSFSGFLIPALATRRMETNIELGPGQSFVIGGLVDDRFNDSMSKIPGLGNIPILGVLFKSKQEKKSKTELIVMVTPEIVDPLNASDPKPIPVMPGQFLPPVDKSSIQPPAKGSGKTNAKTNDTRSKQTHVAQINTKVTPSAVPPPIPSPVPPATPEVVSNPAEPEEKPAFPAPVLLASPEAAAAETTPIAVPETAPATTEPVAEVPAAAQPTAAADVAAPDASPEPAPAVADVAAPAAEEIKVDPVNKDAAGQ